MNLRSLIYIAFILISSNAYCTVTNKSASIKFYRANNPYFQYTGRIQFSDPARPRFWSPGVYIQARFSGTSCEALINDEVLYGNNHNYIEIVVDNRAPVRLQLKEKNNTIKIADNLPNTIHSLTICKNTESGIGYIEFLGLRCTRLLPPLPRASRKIEFIGNSITCGTGSDLSVVPCGQGQWYDQHNAYMSYGPLTARALHAQWHLSSVSGIGLMHSCCNMTITMPQVFDKLNLRNDSLAWDFSKYQPDVVTICLGQNDGIQDSMAFCRTYVQFIHQLRNYYPDAAIVCLTSPMADSTLTAVLQNYLSSIVSFEHKEGDKNVYHYFFSKRYHHGCGDHPDLSEHKEIAAELTSFIHSIKKW